MNKHDSERIAGMLEALGALMVETVEESDVVVFMTCCVREAADTRLYGQVASMKNIPLRAKSPLSKRVIAVGGCIGQRDGEKLTEALPHLDVVFIRIPDRAPDKPRAFLGGVAAHHHRMQQFLLLLHRSLCPRSREITFD